MDNIVNDIQAVCIDSAKQIKLDVKNNYKMSIDSMSLQICIIDEEKCYLFYSGINERGKRFLFLLF